MTLHDFSRSTLEPTSVTRRADGTIPRESYSSDRNHRLLERLREALEANGVTYCQWKGHWSHDRWSQGEGDIDLLVSRKDSARLAVALASAEFKQTIPPASRAIPGVASYYGLDPESAKFVHVHVHYQIPVGDLWTLNYQLPLAETLLRSRTCGGFFPVPAPELEYIAFVVRIVLARSALSALIRRRPSLSPRRSTEWRYLGQRIRKEAVRDALRTHMPYLAPSVFDCCVRSLSPSASTFARIRAKGQLMRSVSAYSRRSEAPNLVERLVRKTRYALRTLSRKQPNRNRLTTGGAVIAVVGGDGAGKTTAIDGLYSWASGSFETARFHLGKPPLSFATLSVAVVRKLVPVRALLPVRAVCIARDRYRLYCKLRRSVSRGRLVLCDRYPTPVIRMDGPSIGVGEAAQKRTWAVRRLERLERSYYDRILAPDLLIVLRVDPEIAAARKTDEDSEYVRVRSSSVWNLNFSGSPAHVIDANRPKADVLADLRAIVWSHL